jgi:cytoskeletal protein CcmA (bactofilin family)
MKGLFRSKETGEFGKKPDERSLIDMDEKPKKKERLSTGGDNLNAFIGEGTTFKGNLSFQGTVRVDGRLEGEILTKDTLVVGKTAEISGARLHGNIRTPSLVIAEGVIFEGSCTMGKKPESPAITKPKEAPVPRPEKVLST